MIARIAAFILLAFVARAETPAESFAKAAAAYGKNDFGEAAYVLRELANAGHFSHGALHNLGNTEWRVNRPGHAILAWERARALAPDDKNTAANLRFARRKAQLDEPALGWHERYSSWLPAPAWLAAASLGLWGGALFLCGPRLLRWRRADWHQALVALLLAVFILSVPALLGLHARASLGVVLDDETPIRLSPTRDAETVDANARFPGGEMARIEIERGDFLYVRASGDRAGWVTRKEFTRVWE